jgi:hypothetical protein
MAPPRHNSPDLAAVAAMETVTGVGDKVVVAEDIKA